MFWKNLSLQQLGQGAVQTFLRFPLTILSALFGTVICYILVDLDFQEQEQKQYLWKLLVFSWLGLILFFDLELITERYGFSRKNRWFLFGGGLLALVAYYLYLPNRLDGDHMLEYILQLFLFSLGLHLLASFAPYINPKTEHGFWQFNEKLFLRFLTATLYSGVLFVGLCVAIVAVKQLFQVDINEKIFIRLWFFMAGVFHPWFFLAGVPKDLQALETETNYPKGLKVFTQFVLLPLVTVYLLILYGYLAKIIIEWEWPRGWVSYLVLSFSIVGIFSLLLIHPIRNAEGNTWIKTYAKWFYRALFPLLILFALAIWRRVSEYGITEERYFVLALAFWLLLVALYFLFSKTKNIKFIPVTLCFLAFLVAFGPWGAFAVSERSQTNRLKYYFSKNGMLSGEKVQAAKTKISERDEAEISSILEYLGKVHNYNSLETMLGNRLDSVKSSGRDESRYSYFQTRELMESLNLTYRSSPVSVAASEEVNFNVETIRQPVLQTSGYDYSFEHYVSDYGHGEDRQEFTLGKEKLGIWFVEAEKRVWFEMNQERVALELQPVLEKFGDGGYKKVKPEETTFILNLRKAQLKVMIVDLDGEKRKHKYKVRSLNLQILVKTPLVSASESGK